MAHRHRHWLWLVFSVDANTSAATTTAHLLYHQWPAAASSSTAETEVQVFPLIKMLAYPHFTRTPYSDLEEAFMRGSASGKVIIDCGLLDCQSVAMAVKRGFVVHGFEPVPRYMQNCFRLMSSGSYFVVPIINNAPAYHLRPKPPQDRGFAFLYQAAVGSAAGTTPISVSSGYSSIGGRSHPHAPKLTIPVVRIDEARIDSDIWLLKMDLQGYELRAVQGATGLFRDHTVAHIQTEFCPRLIARTHENDLREGAPAAYLKLLWHNNFICFDVDPPTYAPALTSDRPAALSEFVDAMTRHGELGVAAPSSSNRKMRMSDERKVNVTAGVKSWGVLGSSDDLVCINIAKVWRATSGK